jgi:hypothetical protein
MIAAKEIARPRTSDEVLLSRPTEVNRFVERGEPLGIGRSRGAKKQSVPEILAL